MKAPHNLSPCKAVALPEGKDPPEWLHLVPYGEWEHPQRHLTIGEREAREIIATFEARGIDLVVDYEHQTLATETNGQPAPAMAWIDRLELRENGVWGHVREWTRSGDIAIRERQYKYLSPVLQAQTRDWRTGADVGMSLHSVALTNVPFLKSDLEPAVNRAGAAKMDPKDLRKHLGLAEDATEEQVKATLLDAIALRTLCGTLLSLETVTAGAVEAKIVGLRGEARLGAIVCRELKLDVLKLPADTDARLARELQHKGYVSYEEHALALREGGERELALTDAQVIAQGEREGKITPALKPWFERTLAKDRDGALAWLRATPPAVPLKSPIGGEPPKGASRLDAEQLALCKSLGLDPEKFAATRNTSKGV